MLILRNDLSNLQSLLEEHFGKSGDPAHVSETVAEVLADIESEGDAAVRRYTQRFDGADVPSENFRVPPQELEAAVESLVPDELAAINELTKLIEAGFYEMDNA